MTRLLDVIDTPKDLRRLSVAELSTLATEVREEVISIVSEVGGHFASTLGAVEPDAGPSLCLRHTGRSHRLGHRASGVRP